MLATRFVAVSMNTQVQNKFFLLGKIFWGTEAKRYSHPYMAFLKIYESGSDPRQCGGFLVGKDIVITAAQCNGR